MTYFVAYCIRNVYKLFTELFPLIKLNSLCTDKNENVKCRQKSPVKTTSI